MRQMATYGGNFDYNTDGKFTKYYSEDGSFEIIRNNQTGEEKHLLCIGGTPYESYIVFVKSYNERAVLIDFCIKTTGKYIGNYK